jgi:tetratricopeptide (TPR) repeat protein
MKQRPTARIQQNLSLLGAIWLLASAACAQQTPLDAVIINAAGQQLPYSKVFGVSASGTSLEVTDGKARLSLPLAQIKELRMNPPTELNQALALYQQKNFDGALTMLQALVTRFRGLPTAWAQQAAATIGSIHLAKGNVPAAEAAFAAFQKMYPGQASLQADVGLALVAVAKKDFDAARAKLEPIAEAALKEKNVATASAVAYSNAFLGLGQINEAEGKHSEALEQYLRTVTLFFHDRAAAVLAQERAEAIRKQHKSAAVP